MPMKNFWRCFVCNDIHYGVKPPEICPTCLAKSAYAEISSEEAKKISSLTKVEFNKEKFLGSIERFTENNEK